MAGALAPFWPVFHVYEHPDNTATRAGQCNVQDEEIAPWVASLGMVLVTIDSDFQTRWVKSSLLSNHGVEVIVFSRDLKGPREQHDRITLNMPHWQSTLVPFDYGYRVWSQGERAGLTHKYGGRRRRSRG